MWPGCHWGQGPAPDLLGVSEECSQVEKVLRGGLPLLHPNLPPAPRGRETCRFLGAPCREDRCAEAVGRVPGLCTHGSLCPGVWPYTYVSGQLSSRVWNF